MPSPIHVCTSSPLPSLPTEILEKIIIFSADSGGQRVALILCIVCNLFYESTMKRLYHTLTVDLMEKLESLLQTSALQKPWVAASVRVLLLAPIYHKEKFPQALLTRALSIFPGLASLCLPSKAVWEVDYPLPSIRRLFQLGRADMPRCIAQNLTHLYLFGPSAHLIRQLFDQKNALVSLTHLLVVNNGVWPGGFAESMGAIQMVLHHKLLNVLKVFAITTGSHCNDLENPTHVYLMERAQKILDMDPRIVIWATRSNDASDSGTGSRFFEYMTSRSRNLTRQCLGALPDGVEGFWEAAEKHVLKNIENCQ
ncbi:hypothetical protein DL96DRAFT_1682506 [Flagelloscypha sp. PMI_526]|nr:hypothetical protein DL96DRAFT_1682506 [Flagelloscypha sp. PMI_526]